MKNKINIISNILGIILSLSFSLCFLGVIHTFATYTVFDILIDINQYQYSYFVFKGGAILIPLIILFAAPVGIAFREAGSSEKFNKEIFLNKFIKLGIIFFIIGLIFVVVRLLNGVSLVDVLTSFNLISTLIAAIILIFFVKDLLKRRYKNIYGYSVWIIILFFLLPFISGISEGVRLQEKNKQVTIYNSDGGVYSVLYIGQNNDSYFFIDGEENISISKDFIKKIVWNPKK